MKNELATVSGPGLATWETPQNIRLITTRMLGLPSDIPPEDQVEVDLAFARCRAKGLDPIRGDVHLVPRRQKDGQNWRLRIIEQISIDKLRSRAAESGLYAGQDLPEHGPMLEHQFEKKRQDGTAYAKGVIRYPEWSQVTVYKIVQGRRCPFAARVYWMESYPGDKGGDMWQQRPIGQIDKCAEAQALRKAFPETLSGMYVQEEMQRVEAELEPMQEVRDAISIDADTGEIVGAAPAPEPPAPEPKRAATEALRNRAKASVEAQAPLPKPEPKPQTTAEEPPPYEPSAQEYGEQLNPRGKYFAIHGSMKWPDHVGDGKAVNYEVWWKVLGRVYDGGKAIPDMGWERLASWAARVQDGKVSEPPAFKKWREQQLTLVEAEAEADPFEQP